MIAMDAPNVPVISRPADRATVLAVKLTPTREQLEKLSRVPANDLVRDYRITLREIQELTLLELWLRLKLDYLREAGELSL